MNSKVKKIFLIVPFVVAFFISLYFGLLITFSNTSNYRGVEENVIYSIQQVVADKPLYSHPETLPYAITQYTPLYYLFSAGVAKAFSLTPGEDVVEIYQVCRNVSLFFSVTLSSLMFFISRKVYSLNLSISAVIFVLSFILPMPWFFLVRPDVLSSLLLMTTGLFFMLHLQSRETDRKSIWFLFLCGVFGWLTFLAKQSGLIIFAAIIGYEVLHFRWKDILIAIAGFLISLVFTSILFQPFYSFFPFSSTLFYLNAIEGVNNGIDLNWARTVFLRYVNQSWIFILLMIIGVGVGFLVIRKQQVKIAPTVSFLFFVFIIILVYSLGAVLKYGSGENYMIDAHLLSLLLIGIAVSPNRAPGNSRLLSGIPPLVYVLCLLFCGITLRLVFDKYASVAYSSYSASNPYTSDLMGYLKGEMEIEEGTYIFTTNRLINNFLYDRVIFPQNEIVTCCAYPLKVFQYNDFQETVDRGIVKYVVLPRTKPLKGFLNVSFEDFRLVRTIDDYSIYVNPSSE